MTNLSMLLDGRQVCALASPGLSGAPIPAAAAVIPAVSKTVVRLIQRVGVSRLGDYLPG
jgi:hypothetical protein